MKLWLSMNRKAALDAGFTKAFGGRPVAYYSAPGRTELSGNHTDHQWGRVLAAAVDLDMQAAVCPNGTGIIRVLSAGYPLCKVDLQRLEPVKEEVNTTAALIRGVAARFAQLGCPVGGFDAYVESTVLTGSGLSSSAAFEVLMGAVINGLFFEGKATPAQLAMIGQYAENVFFGKPCGLMDQMASALGGLVTIDFVDEGAPRVRPVKFDFSECGHALYIIDTRAGHAELTGEYAAITAEMKAISDFFGKKVLRQVDETEFYRNIPTLRQQCGDRAVLRAIHFFEENARVDRQVAALESGDFGTFLQMMRRSGQSSFTQLQNVITTGATEHQEVAVTLALCERLLDGKGGCRVHGGGFAGTVQAFVPRYLMEPFRVGIDGALGAGACKLMSIRPQGAVEIGFREARR